MFRLLPELMIAREVDAATDTVSCPVRSRPMTLDWCSSCPFLRQTGEVVDGHVSEIICAPSYTAMMA